MSDPLQERPQGAILRSVASRVSFHSKGFAMTASPGPITTAGHLHDEAVRRREQGQSRPAVPLCRRALRLLERHCGPDHPDVANVLNTLGTISLDLDHTTTAVRCFRRTARIMRRVPPLSPEEKGAPLSPLSPLKKGVGDKGGPMSWRASRCRP